MGLRFQKLTVHRTRIPFRLTYRHHLAARNQADNLVVVIQTDSGHRGFGEAIPRPYLTGESLDSATNDILCRWWPRLAATDLNAYEALPAALAELHEDAQKDRRTAGYAGLEMACIDAAGKAFGQPARALVAAPKALPTGAKLDWVGPIGAGSRRATATLARLFHALRFSSLKVKVGDPGDQDRLALVRRIAGSACDIHIDANAAWDGETALTRARALRVHNPAVLEQPVPAADLTGLARVRADLGIPVMADESLCTLADAEALVQAEACDMFNLRLAKNGGFLGCQALLAFAREKGRTCQLGALVGETSILTAAGQEFLAGVGAQRYHETSFPRLLLTADPARGAAGAFWRGQTVVRPPRPGLGVAVHPCRLARITSRIDHAPDLH